MKRYQHAIIPSLLCVLIFSGVIFPKVAVAGLLDDNEARKAILELRTEVRKKDEAQTEQLNQLGAINTNNILIIRQEQTDQTKKIQQLTTDVDALKRTVLDLNNQLTQLKESHATLTGQLEIVNHERQTNLKQAEHEVQLKQTVYAEQLARYERLLSELDLRLKQLEPRKIAIDGTETVVDKSEEIQFNTALNHLKSGQYEASNQALNLFIQQYPNSGLLPTAYFWLGSGQYTAHQLKEAKQTLNTFLKRFETHPKSPDARLTLAHIEEELGNQSASIALYEMIVKQYPNSESAKTAEQRLSQILKHVKTIKNKIKNNNNINNKPLTVQSIVE
jgi:tol-pal system protein YbgF